MQLLPPLIVGIALLLAGRKLFWLFVGCVGFLAGATYIPELLPGLESQTQIFLSLGAGIAGALIAIFVKKFAIGMAGFLGGVYIALSFLNVISLPGIPEWIIIIIAGVLGAIVMYALFDLALIVLSSVTGAILITTEMPVSQKSSTVIFLFLVLFGIVTQSNLFKGKKKE
ncbi:DUF4203 domain-containing protein [candidate division KSB1 bacterium]|nr:DUF4203 domain-containing protein [candidate division KSB1 bacterium]